MKNNLNEIFGKVFSNTDDLKYFFAPGRVNLIGEHTDYNGGHVFPCTISLGTYAAAKKRKDKKIRFYSENLSDLGIIEVDLDNLEFNKADDWSNFPKGVVSILLDEGHKIENGFDVVYFGNIPGGGLSSSASLELTTCVVLNELFDLNIPMLELVRMSRRVENDYIGVNCGIMDQFAIGMGKKDHAVLLNTSTMEYQYANLDLGEYIILIGNTNKKRTLADSKYNERFAECKAALKELQEIISIDELGDLSEEEFEASKHVIKDEIRVKRARHAVYENQRTLHAYAALENGDLNTFGKYMNESHISLRDDYEVSCLELDTLVELTQAFSGVLGSRMTGAGFGGCTVSIVKKNHVDELVKSVEKSYLNKIGYAADFYIVKIGDGAGLLK